jgi:diguanylate cyclase (GGDEF)-like protein
VIGIGPIEGAAVTLDAEFTARELQLACRLLAEIVRLRIARDTVAASHQEVMQLAETDPLTGLANRRAWDRRLRAALARGAEHAVWLAVVDLDCFKQVNDHDGYAAGDRTLVDVARAMSEQLRRDDVLARLGGDEFGILLEGVSAPQIAAVLERVRVAVARGRVVSASIGYAVSRGQSSAAELTAAAQRALRVAKQSGGDRTCPDQSDTAGSSASDKTAGGAD